ncbi:MAG: metal ABC transporter permease [Endozoicomonas sp.]
MISGDLLTILAPSFAAGLIILSTHVVLGRQVLARGIVFMDLAVAQIAAMGAVIAHLFSYDLVYASLSLNKVLPYLFSIAGAAVISYMSSHCEKELEAIIGCIYVVAAASILLLLSSDPHGAEQVAKTLNGSILWLNWHELVLPAIFSALFLAVVLINQRVLGSKLFYPLFAILVTLSVEMVGVYLVFSSLIMPALAIDRMQEKKELIHGYLLGAAGYLSGLTLSSLYDLPGGAAIVIALALICWSYRILRGRR